jgi:hypothetical protein
MFDVRTALGPASSGKRRARLKQPLTVVCIVATDDETGLDQRSKEWCILTTRSNFRTKMPTGMLRSDITDGSGSPETRSISARTTDILGLWGLPKNGRRSAFYN